MKKGASGEERHTLFTRQFAWKGPKNSIFVPHAADTLITALVSATPEFSELSECWTNSRRMVRCCVVAGGILFGRAIRNRRGIAIVRDVWAGKIHLGRIATVGEGILIARRLHYRASPWICCICWKNRWMSGMGEKGFFCPWIERGEQLTCRAKTARKIPKGRVCLSPLMIWPRWGKRRYSWWNECMRMLRRNPKSGSYMNVHISRGILFRLLRLLHIMSDHVHISRGILFGLLRLLQIMSDHVSC